MESPDIARLWQQAKRNAIAPLQTMGTGFIYNLLNDMRPVILVEKRGLHPDSLSIRDSIPIPYNSQGQPDLTHLRARLSNATGRLVYVEDGDSNDPEVLNILREMSVFQKIYVIRGGFNAFYEDYPFLCVPSNPSDTQLMMARARWPTEILQKVLYVGNIFNAKSGHQCLSLNIKSLIDLCPSPEPTDKYHYLHVPVQAGVVQFDELISWFQDAPKPVLVYDVNGNTYAPLIAAVFLSYMKNIPTEKAIAYIVSKRPDMDPNPTLFLQVQNLGKDGGYKPPALPSIDDLMKKMIRDNS
jgi:hypothetical protein